MVVMDLLSLLQLSHIANEAERIIYILQLFYEASCSIKGPSHHAIRPCSHGYDIVPFHFGPFQKVVRRGVAFTRVRKKIKRSVPKQVQKLGGTEK